MATKSSKKGKITKTHARIVATFARKLRSARRELGISQIRLALKAGVHISYIGRLERGESAAGIDMVERLAGALGVEPASLLGGEEEAQTSIKNLRAHVRETVERILGRGDAAKLRALAAVVAVLDR